jgi:peptidoglycan/xylan/chitin deacetylase (PgdA/CDA1 family)
VILIKKIIIASILLLTVLLIYLMPTKIPVITYHDFVEDIPTNNMQINKEIFEKEMKYLSKMKYKSLKLKDIECFIENKCKLPKKSVLITMDDGWKSELEIAAPILKKYNLNAVIFYLGENYDGKNSNFMSKEDLKKLKEEYPNIEIASHSYSLHYDEAYKLNQEDITKDIKKMKKIIDSKYYAYPNGLYKEEYIQALEKENYSLAFTFGQNYTHRKLTKNDNKYELPRLNFSANMPLWKFIIRLNWYK